MAGRLTASDPGRGIHIANTIWHLINTEGNQALAGQGPTQLPLAMTAAELICPSQAGNRR
jgi:hypothetical protein